MYPASPQAYDRAITVFSPDGRLFQVEYANEAVKRGATVVGVTFSNGVVLVALKTISSPLLIPEYMRKIFMIDDHVAATASGLIGDVRRLVDMARVEAQKYKMTYGEDISPESLAKHVSDLMQLYTQFGGARPYGVALLMGGIDNHGPHLFEADPSGSLYGYKAAAIGSGKKVAEDLLEKEYKDNMTSDDAILLAVKALKKSTEEKLIPSSVDIAVITEKTGKFEILNDADTQKFIAKA